MSARKLRPADSPPIVSVQVIHSLSKIPPTHVAITRTYDKSRDAALNKKKGIFGEKPCDYICISRTDGKYAGCMVKSLSVYTFQEKVPAGTRILTPPVKLNQECHKSEVLGATKTRLCWRLVSAEKIDCPVIDIIVCSKRKVPKDYVSAGVINRKMVCFKLKAGGTMSSAKAEASGLSHGRILDKKNESSATSERMPSDVSLLKITQNPCRKLSVNTNGSVGLQQGISGNHKRFSAPTELTPTLEIPDIRSLSITLNPSCKLTTNIDFGLLRRSTTSVIKESGYQHTKEQTNFTKEQSKIDSSDLFGRSLSNDSTDLRSERKSLVEPIQNVFIMEAINELENVPFELNLKPAILGLTDFEFPVVHRKSRAELDNDFQYSFEVEKNLLQNYSKPMVL